jgi:hypothetical protein
MVARGAVVLVAALAIADLFKDAEIPALREATLIAAVIFAGMASLLALVAAEPAGIDQSHRWHLHAVASAVVMFMLMATPTNGASGDLLWFLIVVGVASTLVAMATIYREGSRKASVGLALDSTIVAFTTVLVTLALSDPAKNVGGAAILLGAFGAAGFAVAVATRPAVRANPRGSERSGRRRPTDRPGRPRRLCRAGGGVDRCLRPGSLRVERSRTLVARSGRNHHRRISIATGSGSRRRRRHPAPVVG